MISVILPSYGRTIKLLGCIENIRETTRIEVEIVVVLNHDDKESHEAMDQLDNKEGVKVVTMPPDCPLGRPHRCWQAGYEAASGDWFAFGADDNLYNPGWATAAINYPNKGFVALSEPYWGAALVCQFIATREYVESVLGGYFGLMYYYNTWSDNEMKDRAKLAGRYAYCRELGFVHNNFVFTGEECDILGTLGKNRARADRQTYHDRKAVGFPVDWPTV